MRESDKSSEQWVILEFTLDDAMRLRGDASDRVWIRDSLEWREAEASLYFKEEVAQWLDTNFGPDTFYGEYDGPFFTKPEIDLSTIEESDPVPTGRWTQLYYGIAFKHADDAMLFKLTWSQ